MASSVCSSLHYFSFKRITLFLLLVSLYASLFVSRLSDAELLQSQRGEYWGRSRALLALDEEVEEDPLPKKKKSAVSKGGEEPQQVLKQKKGTIISEDLEDEKPKKKKAATEDLEDQLLKKKKKAVLAESDEPLPTKKKVIIDTKEVDEQFPKKKKKFATNNEESEDQALPKKKKTSMEELDSTKPKKKKPIAEEAEENPLKKKTTTITESVEEKPKKKKALLDEEEEEAQQPKKKKPLVETKGQIIKLTKPVKELKNQTKPIKSSSNSTTMKPKTNLTSVTTKPTKPSSSPLVKKPTSKDPPKPKTQPKSKLSDLGSDEEENLITEFRDLPSKLQSAIVPDLERISTTSKVYLNRANREISQSFKPLVGSKYASIIASVASYIFLLAPFVVFPLLYARIRNYFLPLQTILIFVQIYLSIYFSVLSLSFLITGLEPLRFFYATSKASYVYTQVLQMLGYVFYLLMLVMYLVLVFSSKEGGAGPRVVGLAQMLVGLAVGAHYYVAVAHRAVLREAPRTNWKFHTAYALLFVGVCLLARAERRKKAYLHEGGEEGKTS